MHHTSRGLFQYSPCSAEIWKTSIFSVTRNSPFHRSITAECIAWSHATSAGLSMKEALKGIFFDSMESNTWKWQKVTRNSGEAFQLNFTQKYFFYNESDVYVLIIKLWMKWKWSWQLHLFALMQITLPRTWVGMLKWKRKQRSISAGPLAVFNYSVLYPRYFEFMLLRLLRSFSITDNLDSQSHGF